MNESYNKLYLFLAIALMTLLDGVFTIKWVMLYELDAELNPLMRLAMEQTGIFGVVYVKVAALGVLGLVLAVIPTRALLIVASLHVLLMIYWSILW
jgi:hypothetical protein